MDDCTPTVHVVDDDAAVCSSISLLLKTVGLEVRTFDNAQDFLTGYDPDLPGCLVLDVRMPGMDGLELQAKLIENNVFIPVIILTGHGDIAMAVQALKRGAVNFIEKPFRDQTLLDSVNKAVQIDAEIRRKKLEVERIEQKLRHLTKREAQIMNLLAAGKSNKAVAYELDISPKTVDFHKSNFMDKLGVNSVVQLVRLMQKLATTRQMAGCAS